MSSAKHSAQNTLRTVSLGTLWRTLRYPFLLLYMAVIPPMMGADMYGQFAVFMSIFGICEAFTWLGNQQVFGRYLPEKERKGESEVRKLLHGVMIYGIIVTVIVIIVATLTLKLVKPSFSFEWMLILALILLFGKLQGTLFAFLYGKNHIAQFSVQYVVRSAATFLLIVGLYHLFGLSGALWALVIAEVILFAMALWWTRREFFTWDKNFALKPYFSYLIFGLRFYIPAVLFIMIQRSGNLFIKSITSSAEEVSCFDIANQFLILTFNFLNLILATLVPSLTALHLDEKHDEIRQWQRNALVYCGVIIFLAFNALALIGRPLLSAWYGPSFVSVFPNAVIIACGLIPLLIASVGMNYSVLKKEPGVYAISMLGGMIVMTIMSYVLIPSMKSIGAAWATVIAYSTCALILYIRYRDLFKGILKDYFLVLLTGCLFIPLYLWDFTLVHGIVVFIFTSAMYVVLITIFKLVRLEHVRKMLKSFQGQPFS